MSKVLVIGATGQQGSAVAKALLNDGHRVRAMTRRTAAAGGLAALGAEVVAGDLADADSIVAASRGVDTVFLMTDSWSAGPEAEAAHGIGAVDALGRTAVSHVVFSSVASADRDTGIPHFDSKFAVERRLVQSGLPYTIVAPVAFMENQLAPWAIGPLREGTLAMALPGERSLQQIAVGDIGRFVAAVVGRREALRGRRIEIAGDDPNGLEMASALAIASGRAVTYGEIPLEALRAQNPEAAIMFAWFAAVGYGVDIPALRREFPEVDWTDFRRWAASAARNVFEPGAVPA